MDGRWFKEDRAEAKDAKELAKIQAESEKALKNSTLFQRRLERILNEVIEMSERNDEDFTEPNWQLIHAANIARRKTLREIIKLIQLS